MKIDYESFRGLTLHFAPEEIIEAIETMKFCKHQSDNTQGKVVAQYFISLMEDEIRAGPQ